MIGREKTQSQNNVVVFLLLSPSSFYLTSGPHHSRISLTGAYVIASSNVRLYDVCVYLCACVFTLYCCSVSCTSFEIRFFLPLRKLDDYCTLISFWIITLFYFSISLYSVTEYSNTATIHGYTMTPLLSISLSLSQLISWLNKEQTIEWKTKIRDRKQISLPWESIGAIVCLCVCVMVCNLLVVHWMPDDPRNMTWKIGHLFFLTELNWLNLFSIYQRFFSPFTVCFLTDASISLCRT